MGWQERVDRRNEELGRREQDRLGDLEVDERLRETRDFEQRGRALDVLNGLGVRDILRDIQEEWGEGDINQDNFKLTTEVRKNSYGIVSYDTEDIGSASGLFLSTRVPTLEFEYDKHVRYTQGGYFSGQSGGGSWVESAAREEYFTLAGAKRNESKVVIGVSFWPGTQKKMPPNYEHGSMRFISVSGWNSGGSQGWSKDIDLSDPVIMIHGSSPIRVDHDEDSTFRNEDLLSKAFKDYGHNGFSHYHPYSLAGFTANDLEDRMVDLVENMKKFRQSPDRVREFVAEASKHVPILQ